MRLRRESAENGDSSGPEGEFKNRLLGRNRIEIPSQSENLFWVFDGFSGCFLTISGRERAPARER
jgi:hypothetical protein